MLVACESASRVNAASPIGRRGRRRLAGYGEDDDSGPGLSSRSVVLEPGPRLMSGETGFAVSSSSSSPRSSGVVVGVVVKSWWWRLVWCGVGGCRPMSNVQCQARYGPATLSTLAGRLLPSAKQLVSRDTRVAPCGVWAWRTEHWLRIVDGNQCRF
jgi:hypothetical protein